MKTTVNNNNIESKKATREAASKNTRKALCDELCALLGYKAWEIKKDACTGKFAGSYDYSLKFEDGKELYICTRKDLFETNVTELIDGFKRTSKEGYKHGDMVKTKNSGRVAKVMRVCTVCEGYGTMLYLKEEGVAPKDNRFVEIHNLICSADEVEPLQPASEIKDVPAADLCWDEDEQGVKVWGNMEQHAENLTKMGAKRGRVVFKSNKTGLPTGADCWVLPKTKSEDVRQYVRKVHERIICDFSEAREKYGDKGHKYHEDEKVVTIYGRGTVVRGRAWYASDLIDVQLDTPTYNYIWSLVGTPQKMVAVSRNDIVSIELPEPPKEIIIDDATLQEASEIKPKATDRIESRKRTIIARAKEGKQAWRLVKGYEVRVRKAYTNGSSDPENWTYCVSWYADGQLVECENGVRLEQAAKALNDLPQWAEARKAA